MSLYLLVNIFTGASGLLVMFFLRKQLNGNVRSLALSILLVSIPFLVWDSIAATRGDWSFSTNYTYAIRILSLPIEEILFFPTTALACLLIYLLVRRFSFYKQLTEHTVRMMLWSILVIGLVGFVSGWGQYYTMTVMGAMVLTAAISIRWLPTFVSTNTFWLALALCFVPFLIINTILTAMPIVMYSPAAFSGVRVGTIPLEDFFFNFVMLFWYFGVYASNDTISNGAILSHK